MKPKITLITWTQRPIESINAIWQASRDNDPVRMDNSDPGLFQKVVDTHIPVSEMIDFVFLLENISIAFREQMVRHRIGTKVGDRLGVDLIPDLSDSSFWSQTMRVLDMGSFASDSHYELPSSIAGSAEAQVLYRNAMSDAEASYNKLVGMGVPREDARNVIPLSAQHRVVWKLNMSTLQRIMGSRGCWIAQSGLWMPVLHGMIEELCTKVSPVFRSLITPPCLSGECYKGCPIKLENERRVNGKDKIPPCPLYLHNEPKIGQVEAVWYWGEDGWTTDDLNQLDLMESMCEKYRCLWGRDVETGKKI